MPNADSKRLTLAAVAAIAAIAIALRGIGVGYGLPAVYNPDEVALMNRALGFAQGDLNPHNFLYPTFYFYVLFAWEGVWFVLGRLTGVFASLSAFERSFFVDPTSIYLAGRILTVVCGVATVWATGVLAARLFDRRAGYLAALLLGVAPLAVRDAHYVKHDVPVALLIVLTHLAIANALLQADGTRGRGLGPWIVAGALGGLAMSTHYYAVFLVVPLSAAALLPRASPSHPGPIARLTACGLACVVVFFLASPFLLVEPATAVRDVVANREIVMDRVTTSRGAFGSLGFYAEWMMTEAMGRLTAALALAGILVVAMRGWARVILTLGFAVPFLLFIGNTYPASRYLIAILPFWAILAGATLAHGLNRSGATRWATVVVAALAAVEAGSTSLRADVFFRQQDTRTLAQEWIARTVPEGASVLIQPYSVPLTPSRESLVEALTSHLGTTDAASAKFQRELALDPYPSPAYRTIYLGTPGMDRDKIYLDPAIVTAAGTLEPLRALSIEYVVLKEFDVPTPSLAPIEAALSKGATKLATFSPYRAGVSADEARRVPPFIHGTDTRMNVALDRPGPTIAVWRLNAAEDSGGAIR